MQVKFLGVLGGSMANETPPENFDSSPEQEQLEDISPSFKRGGKSKSKKSPTNKNSANQSLPTGVQHGIPTPFNRGPAKEAFKERAHEQAKNQVKKAATDVAKKIIKQIAQRVAQAVASAFTALASYVGGPALAIAIVIFLIIILIFGGLFALSSNGYFGITSLDKLNPKTDKRLVLKALASAKDDSAKRELTSLDTIDAKDALKKISTDKPEAQNIISQINQLLDDIVALAGNDTAILEKIKQILLLLDKLKTLLPDQASKIDALKIQITNIQKMVEFYQSGHLVLNPKDMDYIRNYDVDKRILEMLVYLITPIDQGGAGHERISVKRIKFSYDSARKSSSKETDYSTNEEPNVSAHYTGQAADITEIDCINCTQIKRRRLGGSSKSKLAPIPVKVAWQTDQGFIQGNGLDAYGQNIHQLFNNLGSGAIDEALVAQISDIIGVELDPAKLKGKTLPEISRYIGTAVIRESFNIPGDYDLGNNLGDIVESAGRGYLAQALNVPFEAIQGSSADEITGNIGRSVTETKMTLPAGSLKGDNSGEIFASVGQRFMENSLQLSRNSLSGDYNSQDSFKRALGQGRIEFSLGLKPQSFNGSSVDALKKNLGKDSFDETFANPQTIDNWLGLPTGTSQNFLDGQISPNDYSQRVGEKVSKDQINVYKLEEKRAQAFGVNTGDMTAFANGDHSVFVSIGKTTIAKNLTPSSEEQSLLRQWFDAKTLPQALDEDYLAGQFGLKEGDLGKIFVDDNAEAVFGRVGQRETLSNLSQDPQLNAYLDPVKDYQFYKDRLNLINSNLEYLETKSSDPIIRSKATETKNLVNQLLSKPKISDIKKGTKQIQTNIKVIQQQATKNDPSVLTKVKATQKAINEIIEGRELKDFESLSPDTMTAKTDPQIGLTKKDIYNLITGRKSVNDLVYNIGLKKWEIELDLPNGSLGAAYSEMKGNNFTNDKNTLLFNIGQSRLNEYGGISGKKAEEQIFEWN